MTTPKSFDAWQANRKQALPHQENGEPPPVADREHAKRLAALKAELEEELEIAHMGIDEYTQWLTDDNSTAEEKAFAQDMLESYAKNIADTEQKLNHLKDALQEKERYRAERKAKLEANMQANTQRLLQEHPDWTSAEWQAYSHQQQQQEAETRANKRERP